MHSIVFYCFESKSVVQIIKNSFRFAQRIYYSLTFFYKENYLYYVEKIKKKNNLKNTLELGVIGSTKL